MPEVPPIVVRRRFAAPTDPYGLRLMQMNLGDKLQQLVALAPEQVRAVEVLVDGALIRCWERAQEEQAERG